MTEDKKEEIGIKEYLSAGYPCLFVRTVDPDVSQRAVLQALREMGEEADDASREIIRTMRFGSWKVTSGLELGNVEDSAPRQGSMVDLLSVLEMVRGARREDPICVVFHHVRTYLDNPSIVQALIDAAYAARLSGSHIILVGAQVDLPPELKNFVTQVDQSLPSKEEIKVMFGRLVEAYKQSPGLARNLPKGAKALDSLLLSAAEAAVGLDSMGAESALALSISYKAKVDPKIIQKKKDEAVKTSDVLEFIDTDTSLDQVGGFGNLKDWLERRKRALTEEARSFGLSHPKGILVVGVPGCLTGETVIEVCGDRGENNGRRMRLDSLYFQFNSMWETGGDSPTKARCFRGNDAGSFGFNEIEAVVCSGVKEVVLLTTVRGYHVEATAEHKFFTPRGYVRLDDLRSGDMLYVHAEGELIPDRVAAIDLVKGGGRMTYDIKMKAPHHNFIANGLVVHNSGKSLLAKSVASFYGRRLLRLDFGAVHRKYHGESEGTIRYALGVAESVAPVVMWWDEIERGLAGGQSSGELDSGVASRVEGILLTWMQERTAPVFIVATCNNVRSLSSPLTRRGRFDAIWAVDLPTQKEREEIFAIHLRKRKRDPEKFNLPLLAKRADKFVGAEIEGVIEDALFFAFDAGRELELGDMLRAIEETVCQAIREAEEIAAVREWSKTRARLVSAPEVPETSGDDNGTGRGGLRSLRNKK